MRWQSKKRAALMRRVKAERQAFLEEARHCWVCGMNKATDTHEMACGSHRGAALDKRLAWLATCSVCNCQLLTDYSIYPLSRQLAIKLYFDREHYDLPAFNQLRGRAPGAIAANEVLAWFDEEGELK
ncbi:MAG: hypothetical protein AAF663_04380 [Planctomycetota bacterium]